MIDHDPDLGEMAGALGRAAGYAISRETHAQMQRYVSLLLAENEQQNLISKQTAGQIWNRHILDSAQLVRFAPSSGSSWLDIGSGAGLPGIVVALLTSGRVTLVEPRRLRASFLQRCVDQLELSSRVEVRESKVQQVKGRFDVITARAVASIDQLLTLSLPRAGVGTRWILPKGRTGTNELAQARLTWQGEFRAEPSFTDGQAVIIVAQGVKPRGRE